MLKKKMLLSLTSLIWFIFICDLVAQYYFMYWRFWWSDILMHFMGGFWLALFIYYVVYLSDFSQKIKDKARGYSLVVVVLGFALSVGLLWEIYELFFAFPLRSGYLGDTFLDLIMDCLGAVAVYYFILKKINKEQVAQSTITDKMS